MFVYRKKKQLSLLEMTIVALHVACQATERCKG